MEEVLEIRRWSSYFQEKRLSITFVIAEDGSGIVDRVEKPTLVAVLCISSYSGATFCRLWLVMTFVDRFEKYRT